MSDYDDLHQTTYRTGAEYRQMRAERDAALARVARLEAALLYERGAIMDEGHSWRCDKSNDRRASCTCGTSDAIARIDAALEVEP